MRVALTAKILRTYAREGEDAGTSAYQVALEATGVLPPDVPDLQWSMIMGPEELGAHVACSAALELAIVSGDDVDPGALTKRWLRATDRTGRRQLAAPRARRAAQPLGARPRPGPARAGPAVRGTAARPRLGPAVARAARPAVAGRLGRQPPHAPGSFAGEALRLRELAERELGAISRHGVRLSITDYGRQLLDSPEAMWDAVTKLLLARGEHEFEVSAREAALMLLADGALMSPTELRERVAEVVGGEGWHPATSLEDVATPVTDLVAQLKALGLAFADDLAVRVTRSGQTAALAALRAHALRPRAYVSAG